VWVESYNTGGGTLGEDNSTANNVVRSVGLSASGDFVSSSDRLEVTLPAFAASGVGRSNPVSDIEFDASGNMMVLITQPKKEVFRAFNPACTHLGTQVRKIEGTNIRCTSHGALFDTNSGAVKRGPATVALQKYTLSVESKNIYVTLTK
jgi:Rieske Fe-S protein